MKSLPDALFILICGMALIVIMFIGNVLISHFAIFKVKNIKTYCDEQFNRIDKQFEKINQGIETATKTTEALTKEVKTLNNKLSS